MPLPVAGFIASTAGKRLLFNAALSAVASVGSSFVGGSNKSTGQRATEIGVSTILGTGAAAALGPGARLSHQILANLGVGQATSLLVGSSPGQEAVESLLSIAKSPFDDDDSPAKRYAKLNSPSGMTQQEYRRWYYQKTGR